MLYDNYSYHYPHRCHTIKSTATTTVTVTSTRAGVVIRLVQLPLPSSLCHTIRTTIIVTITAIGTVTRAGVVVFSCHLCLGTCH